MIVYGFCLIFIIFSDSYNKPWNHPLFEIFDYFLLSVPATLIFNNIVLSYKTFYSPIGSIKRGTVSVIGSEAAALPYLSSYLVKIQKNSLKMKKTPSPTSSP